MDGLIQSLRKAGDAVLNWAHFAVPANQQHLADNFQPHPQVQQALTQGFGDFLQQQAQNVTNGAGQMVHNIESIQPPQTPAWLMQFLNPMTSPVSSLNPNNVVNNMVAQTPQYINQGAQFIENHIPGQNILSNAARDAVGVGGGLLSLPGIAAQVSQNPNKLGDIGHAILNEYSQTTGIGQNGQLIDPGEAAQHFYNHPVNTILDLLPGVGLLGKAGILGKAGEAGTLAEGADAANIAGKAGEVGSFDEALAKTAGATAQERLSNLLNYPQELAKRGFTQEQIDQISAPMAQKLIENQVDPVSFETGEPSVRLNSRPQATIADFSPEDIKPGGVFNGVKNWPVALQNKFADWVNNRNAAAIGGLQKAQEFKQYDALGQDGLYAFQENPSKFADLKNYFDNRFNEMKQIGVQLGYKDNYLPQLFEGKEGDMANMTKNINPNNAPFTFQSVLKSYAEAEQYGLKPRYNSLGELAQWYDTRSAKLIADKNFTDYMTQQGVLKPADQAPRDWVNINPDALPGEGGTYFKAPKPLADTINNYLKQPEGFLPKMANVESRIKSTIMSTGVPTTGINWHGGSMFVRNLLTSNSPLKDTWTGAKYLVNPEAAQAHIDANLGQLKFAVQKGLNASIEDHNFFSKLEAPKGLLGNASAKWQGVFEDPLFKQAIPALKLDRFNSIFESLKKSGMDEDTAARTAAKQTNSIFGGKNLDQIGRSKDMQVLLRAFAFAPDFMETTGEVGAGMVKGLNVFNPANQVYRAAARNAIIAYVAANLTNKQTSGHYMWENDPGHTFEIDTGTSTGEGQRRYINPFFSAMDMVKVPMDLASGVAKGDLNVVTRAVANRTAPLVAEALRIGSPKPTNYLGQPLYKSDANLGEKAVGIGTELAAGLTPPMVGNTIRWAAGQLSPEQAVSAAFQAPVRYTTGARNKTEQAMTQTLQDAGQSGNQIYDALQQARAQNAQAHSLSAPKQGFNLDSLFGTQGKQVPATPKSTGDPLLDALSKKTQQSDKQKKINEVFTTALQNGMTASQIDQALQKEGLGTYQDAQAHMIKSLNNEDQAAVVKEYLSQAKDQATYTQLMDYMLKNDLITTSITQQWQKNGDITPEQKKAYDHVIRLAQGYADKTTGTGTRSGSGLSRYGISAPSMPKVGAINIPAPTATPVPNVQAISNKANAGLLKLLQSYQQQPVQMAGLSNNPMTGSNYNPQLDSTDYLAKLQLGKGSYNQ